MPLTYIRIAKTPDVAKALSKLRSRFTLLNDPEIIKFALSDVLNREVGKLEQEQKIRKAFYHAIEDGGNVGDEYLADKDIDLKDKSEQDAYEAIFDSPKNND
jgi:hypothetical protein